MQYKEYFYAKRFANPEKASGLNTKLEETFNYTTERQFIQVLEKMPDGELTQELKYYLRTFYGITTVNQMLTKSDEISNPMLNLMRSEYYKRQLKKLTPSETFTHYNDSSFLGRFFQEMLGTREVEHAYLLLLDTQHSAIKGYVIGKGTINAALVEMREIVRTISENNAANMAFAHNHPSGHLEPSNADIELTTQLKNIGEIMKCPLLDSFIVGPCDWQWYSFREHGKL